MSICITTTSIKGLNVRLERTGLGHTSTYAPSSRGGRQSLQLRAALPPKGVTQPPRSPIVPPAKFGFVENAERLNSRAAMIGFFALLALEAVTNKGLLEILGLSIGKGLDIGL
eukprot:jgi/Picsp_1/1690/NSC_05164-R1_one helix protein